MVKGNTKNRQYYIYSKEFYGKISRPIAKKLSKTSMTPNQITIISISLGLSSGLLFTFGYQIYLIVGIALLHFSIFLDYVDGGLAREKKLSSALGYWIDSFGDRIVDFFVFFGLAWGIFSLTNNYLIWILCSLVLGGHYLLVYTYLAVGWNVYETKVNVYEMRVEKKIEKSTLMKIFSYSRPNIYFLLVVFVLLNNILWYFYLMFIYSWISYLGTVGFYTIKFKKYTG